MKVIGTTEATAVIADYFDLICDTDYVFDESEILRRMNVNAIDAVPVIRCEDCKWGREISGNIECNADMNNPPEYHGYKWFCPLGERKEE